MHRTEPLDPYEDPGDAALDRVFGTIEYNASPQAAIARAETTRREKAERARRETEERERHSIAYWAKRARLAAGGTS